MDATVGVLSDRSASCLIRWRSYYGRRLFLCGLDQDFTNRSRGFVGLSDQRRVRPSDRERGNHVLTPLITTVIVITIVAFVISNCRSSKVGDQRGNISERRQHAIENHNHRDSFHRSSPELALKQAR